MLQFENEINFLFEIGTLRRTARTWNQFLGNDVANVSEHTIRVIWIAIILAKHENIDNIGHIMKLALVHDLSEIRGVDVNYLKRQYATRHEDKAIVDTFENIDILSEFVSLWQEVEDGKTIEAKIVKDADNLDPDFEIVEKLYEGFQVCNMWKENRLVNTNKKLNTQTAKKLQQEIYECNPHNWHFLSKNNRYKGGDMKN